MEQLDEHLSSTNLNTPPSFMQLGITFFIYFILLIFSIVIYTTIFETFGLFSLLNQFQDTIKFPIRPVLLLFVLEGLVIFSNYYLQGRLYELFHQSISKAVLIPILCWVIIIGGTFMYDTYQSIPINLNIFIRLGTLLGWYGTLCLIIAYYFQHSNRKLYYSLLFLHWILYALIFYFTF